MTAEPAHPPGPDGPRPAAGPDRRGLAYGLGQTLAGAGLLLYAATRVWAVRVTPRPGLPELREPGTGAALLPWLPALAVVAFGAAGAVLATRGRTRRLLGALVLALGAVATGTGLIAAVRVDPAGAGAAARLWPLACALGGALLGVGGWRTARSGHRWPVMGARYDRPTAGQAEVSAPTDTRTAWDSLDRGDDPTVS